MQQRERSRTTDALRTLYEVGRAISSTLDFEAVLQRIMTLSMATIGSETASVMLADERSGDLVLVCSHGLPDDVKPGERVNPGAGVAGWVFRNGEPVVLQGSPTEDPRFETAESREHIVSALSVPLVGKHGPIGVLSLNNSTSGAAFTGDDLDLLTLIGTEAGIAVENARLHRRVEEANRQLIVTVEHLRNLKYSLTSMTAPNVDESLETMLDAAVEGTGALAGSLTVLDAGDATHLIEASYHGRGILLDSGDAEYAHAAIKVQAASGSLRAPAISPAHSMIRVLTAKGQEIGLLKLRAQEDGPGFNEDDREFVDALVEHAAIVVYNSMLYQQAEAGREALARAYAELQDKQDQLIRSEKLAAIGQLAAKVCHEINNPLTVISGCTQLLQRRIKGADAFPGLDACRTYLETITSETERCSHITGDLLQFAREQPPRFVEFDLHSTLNTAISLIEYQHPSGFEIFGDYDFEMPHLHADPQQLTQVFLNLLNNAAQAMPEGGTVEITTRYIPDADGTGDLVRIDVRDHGCGLSPDGASRIFDPFYTTKANGTGLGLTICRGILEKHRGTLTLAPAEDGGAMATILLPVNAPAPAREGT